MIGESASIVTLSIIVCLTFRMVLIDFLLSICDFFPLDFSSQKILTETHMLFQCLGGFMPLSYPIHPNEEPLYYTYRISIRSMRFGALHGGKTFILFPLLWFQYLRRQVTRSLNYGPSSMIS